MTSIEKILAGKYPAKAHARKVVAYLRQNGFEGDGVIYLEGQKTRLVEDDDTEQPFRQRRYFFYLSGCLLPDSHLTYHISTDKLTLFIPPLDPESVIWSGLPVSPSEAKERYDVDQVLLTTDVNSTLAHLGSEVGKTGFVFAIKGQIADNISFTNFPDVDVVAVKNAIEESRATKDAYEVAMIRFANDVTTKAHLAVLKATKTAVNERELEAAFIGTCIAHGCRELAYHPIVASGTSSATLHYVDNAQSLFDATTKKKKLNILLDAAGEYNAYCADVTRTFPISGKFSPESRQIYDIVLEMQEESLALLKEGVSWEDVHVTAHKVAIKGLLKLGILRGSEEELLAKRISSAFFPHGLGHYLGMDTHDTGGHPNYEDQDTLFRYLRVRGQLPAGSVITVEPGVYFCRFIIEPYLKSPDLSGYIDSDVLEKYWEVGGVRIEDNIHITKDGYENLTTAPKIADEVELLINGA